jgi:hypothetical protein
MSGVQDFDPNKVAAELFQNLIKDTSKLLTAPARDFFKRLGDAITKNFRPYIQNTIERCSSVKTLVINQAGPSKLFDIYVHTKLHVRGRDVLDDDFIRELPTLKSVVIEGSGGAGKSMMMRYLFISLCNNFLGKLPLFIELRTLNTFQTKDLLTFIHYSITGPAGAILTREQFDTGLKAGSFCVILDGFDEVDVDQRTNVEKQILAMREHYPDLIIIVSSRPDPDNRFQSWHKFHVCRVMPMNREQVAELIEKLDYDSERKAKFLKALSSLFRTHESFLSNPLLCIMMLITFEQYGHIPDKMHIFYEHAFDALFFRHDAVKEGAYRRKTYGKLPIDEFRNCLSAFCIASYSKERFSFTNSEVQETIKQALKLERKDVGTADFLSDLVESVCLLQMEGLEYEFTHRSFQEYFAACFIGRSPPNLSKMLDQFCRRRQDDVIPMVFSMNRALIEREWIIPKLTQFEKMAKVLNPRKNPIGYTNAVFGGLLLNHRGKSGGGTFSYANPSPLGSAMLSIRRLYGSRYTDYIPAKDTSVTKSAVKTMADSDDPRFSKTAGDRIRSGDVLLVESDNTWVIKSGIPAFFENHKTISLVLLKELRAAAADQQSALKDLV